MYNRNDFLRDAVTFTVVCAAIMLWENPDARQALVMRVSLTGKRFCQGQADWWQAHATNWAQTYNRARL